MKSINFVLLLLLTASLSAQTSHYQVKDKIQIGGEGGWDYLTVDVASNRLFLSHAEKVVVVDLETLKVAGEILNTPGVHGITIAAALNRGFISNGRANTVSVFDLKTLQVVASVVTGTNPDAILFDDTSKRVFVFNGRSKDATVFDAVTNLVLATIPMGGKPEFAVRDGKGLVYVNVEDTHEMAQIDAAKLSVTKRYSLDGCEDPTGLAIDTAKRRLFSVCGNKVMVVSDPDQGKVIATVPIGQGSDGAAFDQTSGMAFSSNGEGTLTVVGESKGHYSVVETATTQRGARTMAIDPKTHRLFLPTALYGPAAAALPGKASPRPPMIAGSFQLLIVQK